MLNILPFVKFFFENGVCYANFINPTNSNAYALKVTSKRIFFTIKII